MKIKVWLDSGANHRSNYKQIIDTDKEWNNLSEDNKEEIMREVAFSRSDWGFTEIVE